MAKEVIGAQMKTSIALDMVGASQSVKSLTQAVSSATSAWKSQEAMLKSTGDYLQASQARYEGLGRAMEAQSSKIDAIKSKQNGLNVETQEGASQYLKYQSQIEKAETKLSSMTAQQTRAKSSMDLEKSGIIGLNSAINLNEKATSALSNKLEAQGNHYEALKAKQSGLQTSMSKQNELLAKEKARLNEIESAQGKNSEGYTRQKIKIDELSTSLAKGAKESGELEKAISKEAPTSWITNMKNKLLGLDGQTEKTSKSFSVMRGAMASAIGNTVSNGITMLGSKLIATAKNGLELAEAGEQTKRVWENLGVSDKGADQLSKQMVSLRSETGYAADDIKKLQKGFYGITGNTEEAMKLTTAVAGIGVASGMSSEKVGGMTRSLGRMMSSSTITTTQLSKLETQAPKLGSAMAKAAGTSSNGFKQMVSDGKLSGDQFKDLLEKVSKQSPEAFKSFGKSGAGALAQISSSWKSAQSTMMAPLLNSKTTGLQSINKELKSKDAQKGLTEIGKGIAKVAEGLTNLVVLAGKHTETFKTLAKVLAGLFAFTAVTKGASKAVKALQTVSRAGLAVGKGLKWTATVGTTKALAGIKKVGSLASSTGKVGVKALKWTAKISVKAGQLALQGLTKTVGLVSKGFKALKLVMIANPFVAVVVAITAITVALVALYKHNAKFRNFVNGMAKDAKKGIDNIVKWFKGLGTSISKKFDSIGKTFSKGWSNFEKSASKGANNVSKSWDKVKNDASKATSSAMSTAKKNLNSGWNSIKSTSSKGASNISKSWDSLSDGTKKIAQNMMKNHEATFKSGYKVMEDRSNTWKDLTSGHFDRLGGDTKKSVQDMIKFWKSLFSEGYDYLNKITGGRLGDMFNTIKGIGDSISKAWSNMWNGMKNVFSDIWSSIKGLAKDGMQGVVGFINGGISGIDKVIDFFGGKKQAISPIKLATGTKNGRLTRDTLAVLNDGNDSPETGNREMVEKKDGSRYLVRGTNKLAYLEAGDAVYNATQTRQMMLNKLPHFGLGSWISDTASSVGDYVSDAVNNVSSWIGDKYDAIKKFAKDPISEVLKVFDKSTSLKGASSLVSDMGPSGGHYLVNSGKDWFKELFEKLDTKLDNPGGSGVERWRDYVKRALGMLGLSTSESMIAKILRQINTESGGNPNSQGGDDGLSDGKAFGLMQVKPGTFKANAYPGHNNPANGFDSILAGLKYAMKRYGSDLSFLGNGHGYANGGFINSHQMIEVGEGNQKEAIIPMSTMKRSRAWSLLSDVVSQFASEDNNSGSNTGLNSVKDSEELKNLNNKFDSLLNKFNQLLSIQLDQTSTIANSAMDKKQLYKQQAKDLSILDSQAY